MLLASGIFFDVFGYGTSAGGFVPFGPADRIASETSYIGYALAGLLVGFGTKLSNGCTSGHGLCGLPRFSIRSLVAVSVFLCMAIAVSTLRLHATLGPFTDPAYSPSLTYNHVVSANVCIGIGALLPFIGAYIKRHVDEKFTAWEMFVEQGITYLVGIIFGIGLLVAGMVRRINILGFLGLGTDWNPSLIFVLGCGVLINLVTFNYMLRIK